MRERAPNGGGLEPHETHCHAQRFKRSRRTHARWTNTQAAGRRSGPAPPRKLLIPHPFGSGAQAAASRRPRLLPPRIALGGWDSFKFCEKASSEYGNVNDTQLSSLHTQTRMSGARN